MTHTITLPNATPWQRLCERLFRLPGCRTIGLLLLARSITPSQRLGVLAQILRDTSLTSEQSAGEMADGGCDAG